MKTYRDTIPLSSGPVPIRFDANGRPVKPKKTRYMLTVHLGVINGRAEVVGLSLLSGARPGEEVRPITGDLLRRIPVATIADYVRTVHRAAILREFWPEATEEVKAEIRKQVAARAPVTARRKNTRRPGAPLRYDPPEVAAICREAMRLGGKRRKAVRERYGISDSAAHSLIQRVRDAGYDVGDEIDRPKGRGRKGKR